MELLDTLVQYFQVFLIVWARMAGLVFVAPILSDEIIPVRFRLILAFLLAYMILPWAIDFKRNIPSEMLLFGALVLNEAIVGIIFGFMVSIVFAAFRLATQFFSSQIGLAMSEVFDPNSQEETPIVSYLFYIISILVFIAMDGVPHSIRIITESYKIVPVIDMGAAREFLLSTVLRYFLIMFSLALKLAFPIIASGFIITVSLGLIGKAAPQMNIMVLGLPIQFFTGMIILLAILPVLIEIFSSMLGNVFNDTLNLFRELGRVRA